MILSECDLYKSLGILLVLGIQMCVNTMPQSLEEWTSQQIFLERRKTLLSKKIVAAQLRFGKLHLNKQQDSWNNVLWTDETKVEMFTHYALHHVWRKTIIAPQHKHLIPTVNTVVEGCWFGLVLPTLDMGTLQSLRRPRTCLPAKVF